MRQVLTLCMLLISGCTYAEELLVSNYFGNNVVRFDPHSKRNLGTFDGGSLQGALGMTTGPDRRLYVCSEITNEVQRFDLKTHRYLDTFLKGKGLSHPTAIFFDAAGSPFVANFEESTISRFNSKGRYLGNRVVPKEGGLDGPDVGTTLGPDGKLYD